MLRSPQLEQPSLKEQPSPRKRKKFQSAPDSHLCQQHRRKRVRLVIVEMHSEVGLHEDTEDH